MQKIKKVLISQPKLNSSPYARLIERLKVQVDFMPFIKVNPIDSRVLREQKINLSDFSAVIFTSRNAINHFFRISEEMKYNVPENLRYFCISEAVSIYLQKYIIYRKRRIYVGLKTMDDLISHFKNHKKESFFLPSSNVLNVKIKPLLDKLKLDWTRGIIYETVSNDLSHLKDLSYDILVFFSPSDLDSLFENFPSFKQGDTRIAAFGKTTISAAENLGLHVDIKAPSKETPSMTMALDKYISKCNNT